MENEIEILESEI